MLNNSNTLTLSYSPYLDLYDILIPKTNFWRMLKENVDFSFIRDIVGENYTQDSRTIHRIMEERRSILNLCLSFCFLKPLTSSPIVI